MPSNKSASTKTAGKSARGREANGKSGGKSSSGKSSSGKSAKDVIEAAGAVVTRFGPRGLEVLLVHRNRHADWSIPKGKTERGETAAAAAVREVVEETGVTIRLGMPLDASRYQTPAGPKIVQYWTGTPLASVERPPDEEVDQVAWLCVTEAVERLTYPADRELVEQALELPTTTPLIMVRHAKAMSRSDWQDRIATYRRSRTDEHRPLDGSGRRQAARLVPLLAAYGIARVTTSPATRCVQTVQPYATSGGLSLQRIDELTEAAGEAAPDAVRTVIKHLRKQTGHNRQPTVVCGHRPVLPTMLAALGVADRSLHPAEAVIAHVSAKGKTKAIEIVPAP